MTDKTDLIREIHEYVTTHGGENTATHLLVQAASAIQTQAAELEAVGAGGVQALSAAPAGVSVLSPTEQKWVLQSPVAIAQLLTFIDIDFSQGESVGMDMGEWPPKRYTELKNIGRKIVEQDPDCFDAELLSTFGAASPTPPAEQPHPDDTAVDRFAEALKAKLAAARAKGRGGWDTPECTQQRLSDMLREHVDKGDPRDVANFCLFLWARGEAIAPPAEQQATTTEPALEDVYAELPAPNLPRGGFPDLFTEGQMRDFADRTHALRMEQAAPKAAPGDQFDAEGFRTWVLQNLPDDTIIGSSAWWADHLTTWAQRFVKAAPQQEAQPNYVVSLVVIKEIPTGFNTQNKLYAVHAGSAEDAIGKAVAQLPTDFPEHRLHTSCFVQVSNKAPQQEASQDTMYLLRRLLSNQYTLTGPEFRAELEKIVGEAYQQEAQEPVAFRCLHEWDGLARTSMPPKYACKHCHNFFDAPPSPAPQPAPAPLSDDVVKDAARYRWLIDQHWIQTEVDWRLISTDQDSTIKQLDAAIDAAIAAQEGKV